MVPRFATFLSLFSHPKKTAAATAKSDESLDPGDTPGSAFDIERGTNTPQSHRPLCPANCRPEQCHHAPGRRRRWEEAGVVLRGRCRSVSRHGPAFSCLSYTPAATFLDFFLIFRRKKKTLSCALCFTGAKPRWSPLCCRPRTTVFFSLALFLSFLMSGAPLSALFPPLEERKTPLYLSLPPLPLRSSVARWPCCVTFTFSLYRVGHQSSTKRERRTLVTVG